MHTTRPILQNLQQRDYETVWRAMQSFTQKRTPQTADELWLVEHPPVYTLGLNGKRAHLHAPGDIPVIDIDRGGQVTYHGPGQIVLYVLLDLKRLGLGVKSLVHGLEQAVIDLLQEHGIGGQRRERAPGIYVQGRKVAALGLRITRGYSYHGLSLNVDMDLEPFARIDPCGYPGLEVTQLRDLGVTATREELSNQLTRQVCARLGYADENTGAASHSSLRMGT